MRRSLTAPIVGLTLALAMGCGDGGTPVTAPDPTVSLPGPKEGGVGTPAAFNSGDILPPISREDDSPRIEKARKQIALMSQAVLRYIADHKEAPPSLEAMAQREGGTPYFDPALLLDPWGSRVQYDPKGPMNANKQPDLWSLGPADGSVFIGNWSDKPTPAPTPVPTVPQPVSPFPKPEQKEEPKKLGDL